MPDAPSRLWKGPACQMTYLLGDIKVKWQKEVRTEFEDAGQAAQAANAGDPGTYAMGKLRDVLETYEFPLLLAAEWGQPERLLKLLDRSDTPQARRLKIISLLGEMQADEALPKLKEVLKDRDLAKQAIGAMGNLGKEGIPLLVDIMNTSPQIELQAAAAKGLGQLGGRTATRPSANTLTGQATKSPTDASPCVPPNCPKPLAAAACNSICGDVFMMSTSSGMPSLPRLPIAPIACFARSRSLSTSFSFGKASSACISPKREIILSFLACGVSDDRATSEGAPADPIQRPATREIRMSRAHPSICPWHRLPDLPRRPIAQLVLHLQTLFGPLSAI